MLLDTLKKTLPTPDQQQSVFASYTRHEPEIGSAQLKQRRNVRKGHMLNLAILAKHSSERILANSKAA